ncbi:SelT/SelW/SelH family protein [Tenacibaculum xiamenense]|uniref:hypothetical protein n=1 Tax=Tenacibaculum xiamenense TaxID=1261553 RepID=UPI003892EB78
MENNTCIVKYFWFSTFVGTLVYCLQQMNVKLPSFVQYYLNDFLIIPIVLTICLYVVRKLKGDKTYKISIYYIVYICCGYAIFFEYYLPEILDRYTSDVIDIILYFAGGGVFYFFQKNTKIIS